MAADPEFDLGANEARRLAIAAQGFGRPRPTGRVDARHLRRAIDDVGLLQLDSVNVFCRSHYMPVFSRLGPYPREALDRLSWHENGSGKTRRAGQRDLIEYWGHEASLLPVEAQPLLRWRMARADALAWKGVARVAAEQPELLEFVLDMVRERGPLRASDLAAKGRRREPGEMWNWSEEKTALEYLFFAGRVCAARRVNFERLYDLPERVLPRQVLEAPTPSQEEAQRQLILIAAKRLGVATEADLGDYFRLPRAESKARVAELAEDAALVPVRVEGWRQPAYLSTERPAGLRRAAAARALLTPFDSLVWARERTTASSASATGSRSTYRRRNASTATTSSPSYSATAWSQGSTSRATGRRAYCTCAAPSPSRISTPPSSPKSSPKSYGCSATGSSSAASPWREKATSPQRCAARSPERS
jgi:uncharacterized protein YcaQ